MDIFEVSSQNWTIFEDNFYTSFGYFLRSRYRMEIFLGAC